jgi:hypothetical protein
MTCVGSATETRSLPRRETITIEESPAAAGVEPAGIDARAVRAWLPAPFEAESTLVERAAEVVSAFRGLSVRHNRVWLNPNVTMSHEGEVVLEWWYGAKKLTVYVGTTGASFVCVWGPNVHDEMEDGALNSHEVASRLWLWLT